jgi:dephospho-CoA kinase
MAASSAHLGEEGRRVVVGLTGGIGSGKSNVLHTLVSLGAEGIDADRVAHQVIEPGGPAHDAVLTEFADDVRGPHDRIDRARLGQIVFADQDALRRLEAIIHPAVAEVIRARVWASPAPMVVIEAIKLLEAGLSRTLCDEVWVTRCSRSRQFARLRSSRNMPVEEIQRRIASQMPVEEMVAQADRVIVTDGTRADTGLQVLDSWAALGLPFPAVQVRMAGPADAEGIAAVLNAVVREGGRTAIDRTYTPAQERAFLKRLPERTLLATAELGAVVVGFQIVEPYAAYTGAMDHVATIGTYVAGPARCHGVAATMSAYMLEQARSAGYEKLIAAIRADNAAAVRFYSSLGFRECGRLVNQVSTGETDAHSGAGRVDQLLLEHFLAPSRQGEG